ncbi:MAG TPA: hypothetical protein VEU08_04955 [Vicinamibacterales bacterium]|nr:hypothetical protein [Vicinamibacterales bacterium]
MPTTIDRTNYNNLVDDDGSNTVGTDWNKNQVKICILDAIDALFNGVAEFDFGGAVAFGPATLTTTGAQNDWDIDTAAGVTVGVLRCNNGTALTINGIKAPASARVLILQSCGAGTITLKHQNAGSTAANRLITGSGYDVILTAGVGCVVLVYDGQSSRWRVVGQSSDTLAPASAQSTPGNPVGTTNAAGLMMGLAGSITPQYSGRMLLIISGTISNNTASDGAKVQARYGTGGAPANAGALTGTAVGGFVQFTMPATGGLKSPFSLNAVITGLTLGTAYWLDVALAAITGGTAAITDVSISAHEF